MSAWNYSGNQKNVLIQRQIGEARVVIKSYIIWKLTIVNRISYKKNKKHNNLASLTQYLVII